MKNIITEEMKFMNYTDTVKIVADGPKIIRKATFNSIGSDGYTATLVISGDKSNHPLKSFTEGKLFESGLFDLKVSGPKEKQTEITDFEDEEELWR